MKIIKRNTDFFVELNGHVVCGPFKSVRAAMDAFPDAVESL